MISLYWIPFVCVVFEACGGSSGNCKNTALDSIALMFWSQYLSLRLGALRLPKNENKNMDSKTRTDAVMEMKCNSCFSEA